MIKLTTKELCCGCLACVCACPVGCISTEEDEEGFVYPKVDEARCVNCGKCERVCPCLRDSGDGDLACVLKAYAAKSKDDGLRFVSSSGGIFTELCKGVLASGGAVFGVVMDEDLKGCSFAAAYDEGALEPMRGSKYLQANPLGLYERIRDELVSGRQVLFCGTPCQANALRAFVGDGHDNLLVVDIVCHGVPSPWLWREYLETIESERNAQASTVSFRSKEFSWKDFGVRFDFGDDSLFEPLNQSPYLHMFLKNYCLRPSCYACRSKTRRLADVTIADFWGVEHVMPEMFDELGCSFVVVRTDRGVQAIEGLSETAECVEVSYGDCVAFNSAEYSSVCRPPQRDRFFTDLAELGCKETIKRYGADSLADKAKGSVRKLLSKLGLLNFAKRLRDGIA